MKQKNRGPKEAPVFLSVAAKRCRSAPAGGGGEDEALPLGGVDVVEDLVLGKGLDHRIHQDIDLVDPNGILLFFWLIQSQAQFGPASAKPLKNDPQVFAGMPRECLGEARPGGIGDLHRVPHLRLVAVAGASE